MNKNTILVAGGGGFIGGHLVGDLIQKGHTVRSVDAKPLSDWYQTHPEAENLKDDLMGKEACEKAVEGCDLVYNLACDMGGMGFIENNKCLCMLSVLINTHLLMACKKVGCKEYFYSSSACVYAADKQTHPDISALKESDAYPAMPEDGYGWEKLFGERMCRHFNEDFQVDVRIARFHNVYGTHGTFEGGREKAPAAICRKIAMAKLNGNHQIEVWGDGEQTRSFTYIDDCLTGMDKLLASEMKDPINIGSSEMVTINQMICYVEEIAGIKVTRKHDLSAPQGVRGRNSDNKLIQKTLGWAPAISLREGLHKTYQWIYDQLKSRY